MRCRCGRAFVVACVALPAVSSWCIVGGPKLLPVGAGSNRRNCWPGHGRESIDTLDAIRVNGIRRSKWTQLKMQSGPEVDDGREAGVTQEEGFYKAPGGDGYNPGQGGVAPSWPPQNYVVQDGFGEGIPRLNTVILTGYLGQDPKPRYFDSGKVVLNLSLAVKREYHPIERKAKGIVYGEEETDWFQLEMWNRDAEYAAKVCRKGGRVGVTGALNINEWTDKEGNARTTVKILVQSLEILDSRSERASRSDRSEDNLWESERLQKADAAAQRQVGGVRGPGGMMGGDAGFGGGGRGGSQGTEDEQSKVRKKASEDKWWSAEPETAAGAGGGSGGSTSWWDEDGGAGGGPGAGADGARGVEPDSLPSFFDN